jgi:circadian clock protein KaiC
VQRLALHLTSWQATTFLVGEYDPLETQNNPVFTVADGIFWLTQTTERNASVRRIQVTKLRAASPMPGLHTMVISTAGIRAFPRILPSRPGVARERPQAERASTGIAALDEMLGGGIPLGASVLVVGPSGSGKSVLARQFVTAGAEAGEPGVIAVFEEHPGDYLHRTDTFGPRIRGFVESGLIELLFLRPLDLTVDETLAGIREAVERTGARRLVIDSLSGFELALAPSFRDDFRESLFRMVNAITGMGVTVVMTADLIESFTELTFSPHIIEFLADVLLLQRYVEIEGRLDRVMAVVKTRHSAHDTHIRHYTVNAGGLVVGETMSGYRGVLTGVPVRSTAPGEAAELSAREKRVLEVLREAGKAVPRDVARALGVQSTEITTALARLVALGYVRKSRERGRSVFRADR